MNFKIKFPGGYNIENIENGNIDINVILDNKEVYFGTLFTLSNIESLIFKDQTKCFWAVNMAIVEDLRKETIKEAVDELIRDEHLKLAFSYIGNMKDVFKSIVSFDEIIDLD